MKRMSTRRIAQAKNCFAALGAITTRSQFGGYGLLAEGVMFAVIADGELYLRATASMEPAFRAQPGSPAYNKMVGDMQRLDQVLRELQPVLRTLNEKSNALVFEAAGSNDPQPKKATK